MKFSVFMLVSRDDQKFVKAVDSVRALGCDEFTAYIDPKKLDDITKAVDILRVAGAKIKLQKLTPTPDHHDDVTRTVHRGILEANNQWVLCCDDDDMCLADIRVDVLPHVKNEYGFLHGDKIINMPGIKKYVDGCPVESQRDVRKINGSVVLYNKIAFEQVYRNIDVYWPRELYGPHYGYYWDYKMWYWLIRGGYKPLYLPEEFTWQNMNTNRSGKRKEISVQNMWPKILMQLERTMFLKPEDFPQ